MASFHHRERGDEGLGRAGGRHGRRALSGALIACGVVLVAWALGSGAWNQAQYRKQDEEMGRLQEHVTQAAPADASQAFEDAAAQEGDARQAGPQVDWAALKAESADIVAWVQIPGTPLNYAVFQGPDNDYWLRRAADGSYAIGGEVFLDCDAAAPGMVDQQSVIYGHHMRDGSMFKTVATMDEQAAFDAAGTVWYCTPAKTYELEPLFTYYTTPDDAAARQATWQDEASFHAYLSGLLGKSACSRADAAADIDKVSHVLTLVTCNYYDGYGRTLLVCAPKDEVCEA